MRNKYRNLAIGLSMVLIGLVAGNSGIAVQGFQTMADRGGLTDAALADDVQIGSPLNYPTSGGKTHEPVQ